jgi:hypothetical protein
MCIAVNYHIASRHFAAKVPTIAGAFARILVAVNLHPWVAIPLRFGAGMVVNDNHFVGSSG